MEYKTFTYLWPTRPEKAIPNSFLNVYEKRGWVAQYKKNGTCNVLFVSPEKEVTGMTRHEDEHKRWAPTAKSSAPFKKLPGDGWYVILTEVLHSKVPGTLDTHYIFDILVADGEYLLEQTFEERMELLEELFLKGNNEEEYSHYVISPNVFLAKTIHSDFNTIWKQVNEVAKNKDGAPMDEGLVLKNPKAKLKMPTRKNANNSWMVKCRVAHKNYTF